MKRATRSVPAWGRIVLSCARGVAPHLAREVACLGLPIREESETAVVTSGHMRDAMLLNLHLRTGQRVYLLLDEFAASEPGEVYRKATAIPWERYLHEAGYFSVFSSVEMDSVRDERYVNLKVKDAVADRMRVACGVRPDSGSDRSGAVIFVHWRRGVCSIYLDTSGESLSKRGYRSVAVRAPMQESLAAALLLAAGWAGKGALINPMCGSGTLAIEAALIGLGIAPGLLRPGFAFMHLKGFPEAEWEGMKEEARKSVRQELSGKIVASDLSQEAVSAARLNARNAGVEKMIGFHACRFQETPVPDDGGILIMNPEYGERMGDMRRLEDTYAAIGDFLKQRCRGYRGYVFTGNLGLAKKIGLRSKRRLTFYNGPIECRLLEYELYEGSRKGNTSRDT